jgi:hypothetical protein
MNLNPSDPDIATLLRRIETNKLDLQPNFQRGEVWGLQKKQRLIDTILRGWHIPPIHVIKTTKSSKVEVLDGQQRLVAIRDFYNNVFPINGSHPPIDDDILKLDGYYWDDLINTRYQDIIEEFTIHFLTISDYKPGEPGELFYRLNQPTNLTSAEQRNAYFGEARQQVKDVTDYMTNSLGYSQEWIGFSNSRMAYDDVLAKTLLTIELGTLAVKITANKVTSRYRDSNGFSEKTVASVHKSLCLLSEAIRQRGVKTKFNKATLYSWLLFTHRFQELYGENLSLLSELFTFFEDTKDQVQSDNINSSPPTRFTKSFIKFLIDLYINRSSSRVADTSSVIIRDLAIWSFFIINFQNISSKSSDLRETLQYLFELNHSGSKQFIEKEFQDLIACTNWGERI